MERVYSVRAALYEAHEKQDGEAALRALADLYRLVDRIPDAQVLYVGSDAEAPHSTAFALPNTCRQMVARWGGRCKECEGQISKGEVMYWDTEDRCMICARCAVQDLIGAGR